MTTFRPGDILLPKLKDYSSWSVIACDQHTSDKKYWEKVRDICAGSPSTLDLIFPEAYLGDGQAEQRIARINSKMADYLDSDLFEEYTQSYIYTERTLSDGSVRRGIVGMLDLEDYSYEKGAKTYVRATEGTVLDRLPPRVKIRRDAPLELPHIMMLIDDRTDSVIRPLTEAKNSMRILYDFDLMLGGGHITGRLVPEYLQKSIDSALNSLEVKFEDTYGLKGQEPLIFAAGDGNHSLATAKKCYEELKAKNADAEKARYALVEIVNLQDASLKFEPIHRAVFNVNPTELISEMKRYFPGTKEILPNQNPEKSAERITAVTSVSETCLLLGENRHNLAVGALQEFLDKYIKANPDCAIDYIHGDDELKRLVRGSSGSVGFLLPAMPKEELFRTVILDGALPRKTFSMGLASDKRYYLECRRIK